MSYFGGGTPASGDPAFSSEYDNATYYFSTEANKKQFDADPKKFAPQFGGWCAYALSEGKLFDVDPMRYKLADGKLLMFYRGAGGDTLPLWEANESELNEKATAAWSSHTYSK